MDSSTQCDRCDVAVVGAGMGGLAAAIRLAAAGRAVSVFEAHGWPGGKMRVIDSPAGPIDAGPTVLTLRDVLDELFETAGATLERHLTLLPLTLLARHFWTDGTRLDLYPDADANLQAVTDAFGVRSGAEFARLARDTAALFAQLERAIMRSPGPDAVAATRAMLLHPGLWPWLLPGRSLAGMLRARLSHPHLRQLFGRYATYVGGNPMRAPAVLGLIWQAEAAGVWAVEGGMGALARALASLLQGCGGSIRYGAAVARIRVSGGRVSGLSLGSGEDIACNQLVFNGDPAALAHLLDSPRHAPGAWQTRPRSLSARVWTFSASVADRGIGADALGYHNVFFADDPEQEFLPLSRGRTPPCPTIYVCAQDRAATAPDGPERFQFILNAPPAAADLGAALDPGKDSPCNRHPCRRLAQFGVQLSPEPGPEALTTPQDFAKLFPHSQGALYGLSPDRALATFLRPGTRTRVEGLYLAGGGVHPGAGVPMALISGRHAAEAAMADRNSMPRLHPTAMPGGTSTASATTARARSR